jgi:F-type H+-transporting ATPase subunit a
MLWYIVPAVILLNIVAFFVLPPFPPGQPGEPCDYPVCFINGNLEFPSPHVLWVAGGQAASTSLLTFQVSVTSTILTMILLTVLLAIVVIIASRGRKPVPGRAQNFVEWAQESLSGFAHGMGGPKAARYVPLFIAFFILILTFNWSGLVPPIGKVEFLRAPSSDLNVTIGLALVSFCVFHIEGVRRLGAREYASKFFPLYEFRNGIGAGLIAMFVGLVELLLEFVKPLTLSMRLFGNIYGGEVALGVITGLFIIVLPVLMYGLEIILTFIQALIFSTLTLMFTLNAIESHHHQEGEMGHEAMEALGEAIHPQTAAAH